MLLVTQLNIGDTHTNQNDFYRLDSIHDRANKSNRIGDISVSPQFFLDLTTRAIKRTLNNLMIDGIKHYKIGGAEYEMTLFEAHFNEFKDLKYKVVKTVGQLIE